jgi:2-polyprenyl-6-methoxyphenol hydroxylase-like FAD-dependent oxidoreductase
MINVLDVGGQPIEELRAPYVYLRYSDLRARLVQLAIDAGADVRHGVKVVHVDPQLPAVHLATGETWIGDLIVGADGADGITQRAVTDEEPQHLESTRIVFRWDVPFTLHHFSTDTCSISLTIPDDRVRDDPEWEDIIGEDQVRQ